MNLGKIKVVLASKSPRRKELLSTVISDFETVSLDVNEKLPLDMPISCAVRLLAIRKGEAVAKLLSPSCLVISSDTLVEMNGFPLGKPKDEEDAISMLQRMSGKQHFVHTGIAVHYNGKMVSETATATVRFRDISREEIEEYVNTGEPMDKAGSYGIQGEGGKFVAEYEGGFDTIMGLSVSLTKELIESIIKED